MASSSVAWRYHEQTKYAPETLGQNSEIDWEHPPAQFKTYAGAPAVNLLPYHPLDSHRTGKNALDKLADRDSRFLCPTSRACSISPTASRPLHAEKMASISFVPRQVPGRFIPRSFTWLFATTLTWPRASTITAFAIIRWLRFTPRALAPQARSCLRSWPPPASITVRCARPAWL